MPPRSARKRPSSRNSAEPVKPALDPLPPLPRSWGLTFFLVSLLFALGFWFLIVNYSANRLAQASAISFRPNPPGMSAGPAADRPPGIMLPIAWDGYVWVWNAQQMAEKGQWRLKHSEFDNYPEGRGLHWTSGFGWWLIGLGWIHHQVTGLPLAGSIAVMSVWANPILFALFLAVSALLVRRRCGDWAAGFYALALISAPAFTEGFSAGYPDHHGLHNAAIILCLLGAVFGGLGWVRAGESDPSDNLAPPAPKSAARWFILSAVAGAVGLWVSAFTLAIVLTGVGLGALGLFTFARFSKALEGLPRPELWRLWGWWGGGASLALYLLEYFPNHLGMRLEVNHPLYALAWLGAGELLCRAQRWIVLGQAPVGRGWLATGGALAAVLVFPATIALGGSAVYLPFDGFLYNLHKHISEFQPVVLRFRNNPMIANIASVGAMTLLAACCFGLPLIRRVPAWVRAGLVFSLGPGLVSTAFFLMQSRWGMAATAVWVGCAPIIALGALSLGRPQTPPWLRLVPLAVLTAAMIIAYPRLAIMISWPSKNPINFEKGEGMALLFRDIAQFIRTQAGPDAKVAILSSPNTSTPTSYFGNFHTVGTLYWENRDGLFAAADIFNSRTDEETLAKLQRRGITHVVFLEVENFLPEYFKLQNPRAPMDAWKDTFGYRAFFARKIPVWARVMPYDLPPQLATLECKPIILEVKPNQTPVEALLNIGIFQAVQQDWPNAIATFRQVLATEPANLPAQLNLGKVLLHAGQTEEGLSLLRAAIPQGGSGDEQARLYFDAASILMGRRENPAAAREFLEQAVRLMPENLSPKNNLAWLLATTTDDAVRNPAEAMRVVQPLVEANPTEPFLLGTLGAAAASLGDFPAAITLTERSRDLLQQAGNQPAVALANQRLERFRQQQPWRE